jgi:hypothetical protein
VFREPAFDLVASIGDDIGPLFVTVGVSESHLVGPLREIAVDGRLLDADCPRQPFTGGD